MITISQRLQSKTLHSQFKALLCFILLLPGIANALSGGGFALTDHTGSDYHLEQDRGKLVLMFFGYTSCPDVCPETMNHVASVVKQLEADANQLQILFITVDPRRDTVERLRDYVPWFSEHVLGLTGTTFQIEQVASQYSARFKLHNSSSNDTEYTVDHSADLYLIDRQGELDAVIPFGLPVTHTVKVIREKMTELNQSESLLKPTAAVNDSNGSALQLRESPIQLNDYQGEPLLLNFWASWCEPCRAEIPSLNQSYKLHTNLPLNMVAVNVGESKEAVTNFLNDYPIEFEVALDENGDSFDRWLLKGLPATLVFDKDGSEVMRVTGERNWSSATMVNRIHTALNVDRKSE